MKKLLLTVITGLLLVMTACEKAEFVEAPVEPSIDAVDFRGSGLSGINDKLAAMGAEMRLYKVETLAAPGSDQQGQTLYFNDRGNKQLGSDWVPNDPRRTWGAPDDITYTIDASEGSTLSGLSAGQTTAAIDRAMQTWRDQTCSALSLPKVTNVPNTPFGYVQFLLGFGGAPIIAADITHAGWVNFGVNGVLGVTYTLIWVDGDGNPTDIDNNGKLDVALREILYNTAYFWGINQGVDVETVALHEVGHGLSQAHFGKLFQTNANGQFHFAPLAVMNAGYTQIQQDLKGTDVSGHCSNWGEWPNN